MVSPQLNETSQEPKLSGAQQKVISALMLGKTYVEAAQDTGVTDRTIRRWREGCPAFELALRSQIQAAKESAAVLAVTAAQTALKTLASIAATPEHPHVLRAIQMLLKLNGPLPTFKEPTSVDDVSQEQVFARIMRQGEDSPRGAESTPHDQCDVCTSAD